MSYIVNQDQLAKILGLNRKTITFWQREGLPVALETENGLANQYDTEAVIAWYVAREVAKAAHESEKDRLARLQGDKLEMELAQMRGTLIPADQIEPAWAAQVLACRQLLLALPARLVPLLVGMHEPDPLRELLAEQIEGALTKLAKYEPEADEAAHDAA